MELRRIIILLAVSYLHCDESLEMSLSKEGKYTRWLIPMQQFLQPHLLKMLMCHAAIQRKYYYS